MTGGGGYVGGKLCEALAVRGYAVTSFDLRYLEPDRSDGIRRIQACSTQLQDVVFKLSVAIIFLSA